jgi:23S rRNA (adenine2503-C2)-methyltransferase
MAEYGNRFYQAGDRKVSLNFALAQDVPVDASILLEYFDPDQFLVKITPLNPTYRANENQLTTYIDPYDENKVYSIVNALEEAGYRVIVSIGEVEENYIGSNCGQYIKRHLNTSISLDDGYTYDLQEYA